MKRNVIAQSKLLRRLIYVTGFFVIWYLLYATHWFSEIIFPSPFAVLQALIGEILDFSMIQKTGYSLYLIAKGIGLSLVIAILLTILAMSSRIVNDLLTTIISVIDPLPGIALLPLAILWIGIGENAIVFVIIHSVLWPVLLNLLNGFASVPRIYREVGENLGFSKIQMIIHVRIPASFPYILVGLKTGWARAWRALISAEMVFGATGLMGGLGWDIYVKRNYLNLPGMFATLIVIMLIGVLVEDFFFAKLEKATIGKWGMVE